MKANLVGRLKTGIGHFGHTELFMEGLGEVYTFKKTFATVRTAKVAISNIEGDREGIGGEA